MSRIVLVYWNQTEARERAEKLRRAGHVVVIHWKHDDGPSFRKHRRKPPDAFVIGLERLPSHGRAVGTWVRQQKDLRDVPIIFVGGAEPKVIQTRKLLPDAVYTDWRRVRGAITKAASARTTSPVVPGTMSGYSGTPLPKKLGIKAGDIVLLGAPKDLDRTLGVLPEGVRLRRQGRGRAEMVILFARSAAELERRLRAAEKTMAEGGSIWIAWPKQSSGVKTDLTQAHVRATGLARGLVDYKICAIDETWSGLRFARRRA